MEHLPLVVGSYGLVRVTKSNNQSSPYNPLIGRSPKDIDLILTENVSIELEDELISQSQTYDKVIVNGKYKAFVPFVGSSILPIDVEIFDPADSNSSIALLYDAMKQSKKSRIVGYRGDGIPFVLGDYIVPEPAVFFALKKSHRFKKDSPHFWKTAKDYHMMKLMGFTIPDYLEAFLKKREEETYTNSLPKLNVDKKDFFTTSVKYVYDHDDIHEAVKIGDVPAYTLYKGEDAEVMCDKIKFFELPHEIRIRGVMEESYVLALERSQIPHPGVITPKQSYLMALSKVCSSITSGWFREFAYENIWEAVNLYDESYMAKFQAALAEGKVKDYEPSSQY